MRPHAWEAAPRCRSLCSPSSHAMIGRATCGNCRMDSPRWSFGHSGVASYSHQRGTVPRRAGAWCHAARPREADASIGTERRCAGGSMTPILLRRVVLPLPVLFGVATLVFSLIHLVPGDPVQAMLGESASREDILQLRSRLGLDRPLYVQYATFMRNAIVGDLGMSL